MLKWPSPYDPLHFSALIDAYRREHLPFGRTLRSFFKPARALATRSSRVLSSWCVVFCCNVLIIIVLNFRSRRRYVFVHSRIFFDSSSFSSMLSRSFEFFLVFAFSKKNFDFQRFFFDLWRHRFFFLLHTRAHTHHQQRRRLLKNAAEGRHTHTHRERLSHDNSNMTAVDDDLRQQQQTHTRHLFTVISTKSVSNFQNFNKIT